jgi:hypothetical protein
MDHTPDNHVVPLPPPPRQVRGGAGPGLWLARVFMLPHTFIGIASIAFLIFLFFWAVLGTTVPGVITDMEKGRTSKGGDMFSLKYSYTANGVVHEKSQGIDRAEFDRLQNLSALSEKNPLLTVKFFTLGSLHYAALPAYESSSLVFVFLGLWAAIWNGVVGAFIYQLWVKPARLWSLYKNGLSATGIIVSKRMSRGRSPTCFVSYVFQDPATGHECSGECEVKRIPWETASEGQKVTVIYAAENPNHSTVFGMGDYDVRMDTAANMRR